MTLDRRWVLPVITFAVLLVCVAPFEDLWITFTFASDDVCEWGTNNGISCGPVRALHPLTTVSRYATAVTWVGLWLIPRRPRLRPLYIANAVLTLVLGFLPILYTVFLFARADIG